MPGLPRARPSCFVVVLFGCWSTVCLGSSNGPTWWRLVGGGGIPNGWHLCDVRLYVDDECMRPVGIIQEWDHSSSAVAKYTVNTMGQAFSEWSSACNPCSSKTFIAARFTMPTMVQCIQFTTPSSWSGQCATTTVPPPKIVAPTPAPPTPPQAPETVTTTTSPGTTKTVTNPFTGLQDDLDGLDFGGRLLSGEPVPAKIVLERSEDGSSWSRVMEWSSSAPSLRMSSGTHLVGPQSRLMKVSEAPASMACGQCKSVTSGVQAQASIAFTFNEWVRPGSGSITVTRGGGLQSLALNVYTEAWFQFFGKVLTIRPQVAWGLSSTCAIINFPQKSVVDADGFGNEAFSYTMCLADTIAPTLSSSTPANGATNVAPISALELSFNEAVQISTGAGSATLSVTASQDPAETGSAARTIAMNDENVQIYTWDQVSGGNTVAILLPKSRGLAERTTYKLQLPAGSIKDAYGNAWAPTPITFRTVGWVAASTTTVATTVAPVVSQASADDGMPVWIFAVLGLVVLLCCLGLGVIAWWQYVSSMEQQIKLKSKVAPAGQAPSTLRPTTPDSGGPRKAAWAAGPMAPSPKRSSTSPAPPKTSPVAKASAGGGASTPVSDAYRAQRRPKEAEDAGSDSHRRPPPPFHKQEKKASPGFKRAGSFTDDNINSHGDSWVKAVDDATGRSYWFNRQTLETRWDKPPNASDSKPSSSATSGTPERPKTGPQPQAPKAKAKTMDDAPKSPPPPAKIDIEPGEDLEVARVKEDVMQQLQKTRKEDGASRKKTFKFMCVRWHPDKNSENPELATSVFQFLQQQRDWYLKDA